MTTEMRTWSGNEALEQLLVPTAELHPHPRNPRRGATEEIRSSLRRFGQQRPVLALPDGTLVAGHHVWRAAVAEGWSHLAVVRSDLGEREVDAYLLADNRLADLGLYDDQALAELLRPLAEDELLAGVGYGHDDVTSLLAYLELPELAPAGPQTPSAVPAAERPYATGEATLFRIILMFDQPTYEAMIAALEAHAERLGVDSYSAVIARLVLDPG